MKQIFAIAVAVSFFGILAAANGQSQTKTKEVKPAAEQTAPDKIKLPESQTTAILTMEYSGGFGLPPAEDDWVKPPFLQVFADGRVVNGASSPEEKPYEFKLKPEQLQDLLKQVIEENKFYEIDAGKITNAVKAAGGPKLADATTLEVKLELPQGSHEVSVYAPRITAKQLPKIKGLQQVANIEILGRKLVLVAVAGGYENVDQALTKVNKQLKEKGLDLMTPNELYTCKRKDGVLTMNFNRKYYNENGRWKDWINAKFTDNGDQETVEIKTNIGQDKKKPTQPKKKPMQSEKKTEQSKKAAKPSNS